jgi:hypothetical protein
MLVLGSIWLGVFGGEGRGGERILLVNCVWFIFLKREDERRGGNIRPFLLPPNWGDLKGR